MRQLGLSVLVGMALIGCGSGPGPTVDGGGRDAGGGVDGGPGTDSGPPVDGGGGGACVIGAGTCDLLDTSTCEPGQGCLIFDDSTPTGASMCGTAGVGTDGAACVEGMQGMCAEGHTCDGTTCREFCCHGSSETCPIGQTCVAFAGTIAGVCRPGGSCTLLPQAGCDAGQGCYPFGNDGTVMCFMPTSTAGAHGAACEAANACTPGHVCLSSTSTCARMCEIAMNGADCPDPTMQRCGGLGGQTTVGVCIPMM